MPPVLKCYFYITKIVIIFNIAKFCNKKIKKGEDSGVMETGERGVDEQGGEIVCVAILIVESVREMWGVNCIINYASEIIITL